METRETHVYADVVITYGKREHGDSSDSEDETLQPPRTKRTFLEIKLQQAPTPPRTPEERFPKVERAFQLNNLDEITVAESQPAATMRPVCRSDENDGIVSLRDVVVNPQQDDHEDVYEHEVIQVEAVPVRSNENDRRDAMENARVGDMDDRREIDADIARRREEDGRMPTYMYATGRRVECHFSGEMDMTCNYCQAMYFRKESTTRLEYTKCCNNGRVDLPPLTQPPELLRRLFQGQHALSRQFRQNVNAYNNCFQFASIQANLPNIPGRGPYVYRIQGQIYFHFSDVNVRREIQQFGPLYFLDPEAAAAQRVRTAHQRQLNVDDGLIRDIGEMLGDVNPFARQYRHLHDVYTRQVEADPNSIPRVCLEFVGKRRDRNRREHDLPEVEEVAAVYEYHEDEIRHPKLRVFLTAQDDATRPIDYMSDCCDPLSFPLLFPRGDLGWNTNIPLRDPNNRPRRRERVSLIQFYAYRFARRYLDDDPEHFDIFRFAGRLTQKFVVASFLKVEGSRLEFIRQNQDHIRANEYQGLADHVRNRAAQQNLPVGRLIVLPSTFSGGARSQMQRYQDAMAVVAKMGYPSLFITFTCNPRWREIIENLPANDNEPSNHPFLICRVFQLKLQELMEDLTVRQVMGISFAHMHVIEFQKRGLPHAHILITLRNEDKPVDAVRIDQLVSAELPDPETERELFDLVGTHMIHGPCGAQNPDCVCMQDGKCTKQYPKYWQNDTRIMGGRVYYRRRQDGRLVEVRRANNRVFSVGNDYVVPYNPYLLLKYRTHVNVEVCTTSGTVKYLHKYFFKSEDRLTIRIVQDRQQIDYDEITAHLNTRFMTPTEAAWRTLSFHMHANSHHVERLPIHLPDRHHVVFRDGEEQAAVENNARTSRLLQWFETNRVDPEARRFLYDEFPQHFVWDAPNKRWNRRQRTNKPIVSRIFNVSLRNGELYFLRLLLLHVRGAISFEDLRTVDGNVCETFQEACRERNLLAEDREWFRSMNEAREKDMPKQMRQMFAYILAFGIVDDPPALWRAFRESLMEDYVRRRGFEQERAENATLRRIQYVLNVNGRRLADFGLPEPPAIDDNDDEPDERIDVPAEEFRAAEMIDRLNADQREVFDAVMRAVDNDEEPRRLFFLRGAAGTGKTFLYNTIITTLNGRELKAVTVAWTGLAASLLKHGRTVHSTFKLPLAMVENSTSSITFQSEEGRVIRDAKLIICDEISMMTRLAFDIVEKTLRFLCNNDRPFGGKCVVVGGDFKQCLPVVVGGDRAAVVQTCVKTSRHWPLFESLTLNINMRVLPHQERFVEWLEQLGNGTLRAEEVPRADRRGIVPIPEQFVVPTIDELVRQVFGDVQADDVPNRAILTPLNENCHAMNRRILDGIRDRPERVYLSADSVDSEDQVEGDELPNEFLNSLNPSGFPQHRLSLKEGCAIMLLRNLNVRENLCNGTRLMVRKLGEHHIEAQRLEFDGRIEGRVVFIPRVDFVSDNNRTLPFRLHRRQFPVRLAYAMTINKSQGQTFERVGIFLPQTVFDHGQLYVAFSRATSIEQVFVCVSRGAHQGRLLHDRETTYTKNIVYREIL